MDEPRNSPMRLLASGACMAAAGMLGWFSYHQFARHDAGLTPHCCALAAIGFALAAIAIPSRSGAEAVTEFLCALLECLAGII